MAALVCFVTMAALNSCSSFKSKKRLDMGRFAEDMITVAGEIQYSLGQRQAVYLRDYSDTPELVPFQYQTERARRLVLGVIEYSIQLVTVGDSRKPDHEKAVALAGYLEEVLPAVVNGEDTTLDLTRVRVDTILTDIRAQERFLDALSAVRSRIEERFRDVRAADEMLERRQIQAVFNGAYLRQIRMGVPDALDSLLAREPSLPTLVDPRDGLDNGEIQLIEERMLFMLAQLRETRQQLDPISRCTTGSRRNWMSWRLSGRLRCERHASRSSPGRAPTNEWPRA